jgi:hypothetical protein
VVAKTASTVRAAAVEHTLGPAVKFTDRLGIDVEGICRAVERAAEHRSRLGRGRVVHESTALTQVSDRGELSSGATRQHRAIARKEKVTGLSVRRVMTGLPRRMMTGALAGFMMI